MECSSRIPNGSLREKRITFNFTQNSLTIANIILLIKDAFQLSSKKILLYDWKGIEVIEDADLSNMTNENEARRLFFIRKGDTFDNKNILRLFTIGKVLGEGGFGKVYHATLQNSLKTFAIKFLRHHQNLEIDFFYKEINLLLQLEHKNIIKLHSYCATEDGQIVLIMEYACGGTLKQWITQKEKLPEETARDILYQILQTVEYCHDEGVIHRDLKTDNILFNDTGHKQIKIIDFGISTLLNSKTNFGSLAYIAPEVISGKDYSSLPSIDIWAIGCILYEMVVGQRMFQGKTNDDVKEKILHKAVTFPQFLSIECVNLINMLTNVHVSKRFTIEQALTHPWIRNEKLLFQTDICKTKLLFSNKSFIFAKNNSSNSSTNTSRSTMQDFFNSRKDMKPKGLVSEFDFSTPLKKKRNKPRYMAPIGHNKEQVRTRDYFSVSKEKEKDKEKDYGRMKRMESCKNVILPYLNSPSNKSSNKFNNIKMKYTMKLHVGFVKL